MATAERSLRLALLGSPNSGKTTLFNALTGLRAKTGNYPGVTVSRYEGIAHDLDGRPVTLEDLPGTYSLDPISPDELIVTEVLDASRTDLATPDGLLVLLDATTLRRSLGLLAQALQTEIPVLVVLTFRDELARRQGNLDVAALERALGVAVVPVVAGARHELGPLRARFEDPATWPAPVVLPPTALDEIGGWIDSVLTAGAYAAPDADHRTNRVDGVLLHPVWGTLIFFVTMFAFFQVIFSVAAPLQGYVESFFAWLSGLVGDHVQTPWLASFLGDALIGGVGSVLVFLPQIALLFVLISVLEASGYLSRAAVLMDRVMARAGLEGRAFVALLSSMACAIPGIMATRSLPSARDRLATMMGAPLMTCSARLPVYILLVGLLVAPSDRIGPIGAQGALMFALYLLGAISSMLTAWLFKRLVSRSGPMMPFYMEMPAYRLPKLRFVALSVFDSCKGFVRKVGRIILLATVVLWLLLNLPVRGTGELERAGIDPGDATARSSYVLDHSYGAAVGRAVEPVFAPLGFDWRINVGVLASLSAREVFVATLGQVAAAQNPDNPTDTLQQMRWDAGPRKGQLLFTPATIAALMAFFLYALQCTSTIGMMRRETGTWKWPAIAFGYMFGLAWGMAFLTYPVVGAFT
ncbi:MAG: ferrous iron transporter B [Marmoricola sp.]